MVTKIKVSMSNCLVALTLSAISPHTMASSLPSPSSVDIPTIVNPRIPEPAHPRDYQRYQEYQKESKQFNMKLNKAKGANKSVQEGSTIYLKR